MKSLVLVVTFAAAVCAQERPADASSVDGIIRAAYDTISGPAGKARDWDRFRSLMRPDARLIVNRHQPDGSMAVRSYDVEGFIERFTKAVADQGFYERGVFNHVDEFAHIAQVFSTYESRHAPDEKPFARGINSFQLANDGKRWWI